MTAETCAVRRPDDPEGRAGRLVVSASDLAWFSRCAHRSTMDRAVLEGAEFERSPTDPFVQILIDAGIAHEVAYLEHLRATLGPDAVVDCSAGDLGTQVAATRDALERGVPVVFQAALLTPDPEVADVWWQGHIDFAVRAPDGTYEPHDTKLGANPKAPWAVQLAVYGAQLGFVCGTTPQRGVVVSPGGDGFTATEVNLDAVDLDGLRRGLVGALTADAAPPTLPDRKGACSQCLWTNICDDERRRQGSLTLVRDIRANQVAALREVGVATIDELAACHPDGVPALTGVSDAVIDASERGVVTSVSVITLGPGFADSVRRLASTNLGVGAHLAAVGEDPPLLTVESKVSYGMDLDGARGAGDAPKSCPHQEFTGVDGTPGVDNQMYRLLGCHYGWRRNGVLDTFGNEERRNSGRGVVLMEITGIVDPRNSPSTPKSNGNRRPVRFSPPPGVALSVQVLRSHRSADVRTALGRWNCTTSTATARWCACGKARAARAGWCRSRRGRCAGSTAT
jgi:hypothetical protein